jgi:hypothetical protein
MKDLKSLKQSDLLTESNTKVVWAMFAAKAYVECVRGIIVPKQIEVLNFYQFTISDEIKTIYENRNVTDYPQVIEHPRHVHLLDATDMRLYCEEMKKFHHEKKFKLNSPNNCPLLEAESFEREVKRNAVDFFEPYFGLNSDKLISAGLSEYNKFIDLLMTMFAANVEAYNEKHPIMFIATQKPDLSI